MTIGLAATCVPKQQLGALRCSIEENSILKERAVISNQRGMNLVFHFNATI
jgi:hypothetical protein